MSIETTGHTVLTTAYGNGWAVALLMRDDPRFDCPYVTAWDTPAPTPDAPFERSRGRCSYATKTEAKERFNRIVDEQIGRVLRAMSGISPSHAVGNAA